MESLGTCTTLESVHPQTPLTLRITVLTNLMHCLYRRESIEVQETRSGLDSALGHARFASSQWKEPDASSSASDASCFRGHLIGAPGKRN